MSNLRARFPVPGKDTWTRTVTTLACSHYDTKWFQSTVFVGANDGGSSTGLLLEIARATAPLPDFAASMELVFFDGEEAITGFTQPRGFNDTRFDGLYGSRHYAKELRKLPEAQRPKYGIVFDIIGGEPLEVEFPDNCSKRLSSLALEASDALSLRKHFRDAPAGAEMVDDHVPLGWLGIEVLNFISLNTFREYWHTSADTIDKVFPKSIEITGRTGLYFIERSLQK
jgi:glutaminyl-peptide cyclotransferase